jgi:1-acyl-sn-glycerol-3-phosphate acyltransferase
VSDLAYNIVWQIGVTAFWTSSSPIMLHRDRLKRPGAYILAPSHLSPYDVPCLMAIAPRNLDWVSIVETFRNPLVALLFSSVNTFALDRSKPDSPTVRTIFDRLKRGRVVAMFPEGKIKTLETSVLNGAPFKPGIGRIAQIADVPVIPCAIVGTGVYSRFTSWLPLRRVRYGVNFGEPMFVRKDIGKAEALAEFLEQLRQAYLDLYAELRAAMPPKKE